jgi:protoporphyrinogen oxidase
MKLLILGGGVAGAVAAQHAYKQGIFENICLIEKENYLGGIHRDVEINQIHYDIGSFFFSSHHELINIFPELTEILVTLDEYKFRSLTNNGTLDYYPPTASHYVKDNGVIGFVGDILQLVANRVKFHVRGEKFETLDDKIRYLMGPLYEKMGLKYYISRLYGCDSSEVSLDFSTKRLQYLQERLTLNGILSSLRKSVGLEFKEEKKSDKFDVIRHVIYIRPKQGFSSMYNCIFNLLKSRNIDICLETKIEKIFLQEKKALMSDGTYHVYDNIISSIPLGLLCKLCDIPLNIKLDFKPLYSLFYECDEEPIPESNVLFNFTTEGQWKRVTFHSNAYGPESNRHYFIVESMPLDRQLEDPSIVDILDKDFRTVLASSRWGVNINNAKLVGSHLTPNAYPIYGKEFDIKKIDELQETLKNNSIYLSGRQGTFDYITSSDAALSSIKAVDLIVKNSAIAI